MRDSEEQEKKKEGAEKPKYLLLTLLCNKFGKKTDADASVQRLASGAAAV
jgi:hypothetical protein